MTRCACGQPLHYTNPDNQAKVQALVDEQGEYVPVTCDGRTWLVQRHYIALHGIKGWELSALGFQEVVKK